MNQVIQEKLADFDIALYQPIHKRSLSLGTPQEPKAGNLVKVICGMRRSGKSYRLFQEIQTLTQQGVPENRICYFNFEDDRLGPATPQLADEMLDAFELQNPGAQAAGFYLFLDEIQELQNWGQWLRRIVDTKRATIYVTGSSSQMLSTEIATQFRGRALEYELLPLSFAEYLTFNGITAPRAKVSAAQRVKMQAAFNAYLQVGGFPAAQQLQRQEAITLLQSYAQRVVARDVIERHNLENPRAATLFTQRLLSMNGRELSVRKTANDLNSAGVKTSRAYLANIINYLQDAYLLFALKEQRYSLAEATTARPKIYAVDPGLALANARACTNDAGQRLENAVYLELRRRSAGARKDTITFTKTKAHAYEIDFVVGDALDPQTQALYQVAESVTGEKTLERELRALWEAMDERGCNAATLIVGEGVAETYTQGGKTVQQIPAWQWFTNPEPAELA
jgi:hypothetical protein